MIAFIDCFIQTPVNNCFNYFTQETKIPATYHMPAHFGFSSLETLPEISKIIILGSASHISENLPWHKELLNFVIPKLESGVPVLGLCFGHQLLAANYGCSIDYIDKNEQMRTEARELIFKEDLLGFKQGEKIKLGYAHAQIISKISNEFDIILESDEFQYEGIKHKSLPLISFQGHPEASELFLKNEAKVSAPLTRKEILKNGIKILEQFSLF